MDYKQRLTHDMQAMLSLGTVNQEAVSYQLGEALDQQPEVDRQPAQRQTLANMWRVLLEFAVSLAENPMDKRTLIQSMNDLAGQQISRLSGPQRAFASRIMGELPRLLNLPLLLEIAKKGFKVPALAALNADKRQNSEIVGGKSQAFALALKKLHISAQSELTVLLSGETGSGKGLLARRMHAMSPRHNGPFVSVNCASLVSTLWESELFGHVRGAFTGATQNSPGYIRSAQGGTLFLDEIGESSLEFQSRLLTVLEDRVVYPVGSSKGFEVNFRLIAASHVPLEQLVRHKRFLPSLMYRLQVLPIHLPPLRQRHDDLPALIDYFLHNACLLAKRTRTLHPQTRHILLTYSWPGNVRQLMNLMQQLVTMSPAYQIMPSDLPEEILNPAAPIALNDNAALAGLGINRRYLAKLTPLLQRLGNNQLTNRMLRQELGCSESAGKNILRCLSSFGILQAHGQRGGRYYLLSENADINDPPE